MQKLFIKIYPNTRAVTNTYKKTLNFQEHVFIAIISLQWRSKDNTKIVKYANYSA